MWFFQSEVTLNCALFYHKIYLLGKMPINNGHELKTSRPAYCKTLALAGYLLKEKEILILI